MGVRDLGYYTEQCRSVCCSEREQVVKINAEIDVKLQGICGGGGVIDQLRINAQHLNVDKPLISQHILPPSEQ